MSRTFKDKLSDREKSFKRDDQYLGWAGDAHAPSHKKGLKKQLTKANRRELKRQGIVE